MMRADADRNGMAGVRNACSTCCRGGCYTALGTDVCATGYAPAYTGRVGGIEAFNDAAPWAKTLCVDASNSAPAVFTWDSGYSTRLMRHREVSSVGSTGGMESVTSSCAVCCK